MTATGEPYRGWRREKTDGSIPPRDMANMSLDAPRKKAFQLVIMPRSPPKTRTPAGPPAPVHDAHRISGGQLTTRPGTSVQTQSYGPLDHDVPT